MAARTGHGRPRRGFDAVGLSLPPRITDHGCPAHRERSALVRPGPPAGRRRPPLRSWVATCPADQRLAASPVGDALWRYLRSTSTAGRLFALTSSAAETPGGCRRERRSPPDRHLPPLLRDRKPATALTRLRGSGVIVSAARVAPVERSRTWHCGPRLRPALGARAPTMSASTTERSLPRPG